MSKILAKTPLSIGIFRSVLYHFGHRIHVPLTVGPLRGLWWQPASGGKLGRLLLGNYEPEQSALFVKLVHQGEQVLDIGASTGYYTLLSAQRVGKSGRVLSFEPCPQNLKFLETHVHKNRLFNVTVLPVALADETGITRFINGTGTGTGRLCKDGQTEVAVRRLDEVVQEMGLHPHHLKIDVEGAELAVLRGGENSIQKFHPTIFLSTHEVIHPGIHSECCKMLRSWGYRLTPIIGPTVDQSAELICIN